MASTTMATTTLPSLDHSVLSREEREHFTNQQLQEYRSRPSTLAAEEFFQSAQDWRSLPQRVERLCQALEDWANQGSPDSVCSFSEDPHESRRQAMTAAIMARADPAFLRAFQKLFQSSLLQRQERAAEAWNEQEEELALFANLRRLGWIHQFGLLQQPLGDALHSTILNWVRDTISTEFERDDLFQEVEAFQQEIVLPWLENLMGAERLQADDWPSRIIYSCAECFCLVRKEEIFDLVADFPDSLPAVLELKMVLERTKMHSSLGQALKQSLIRRLNHPGAGTNQIIDVYINTIKVLREIDPSDRLLQVVAEPVRSYLRRRHNTVRCIITSLTDAEVGGELYEELRRQDARPLEHHIVDSDDEEEPPGLDWQPPPPITKPKGTFLQSESGKSSGGDILSMLVSIYGSKELFVNEYRLMLADKLLANLDFSTDKEVHTLELLKLRFGELSMRNCEIMIKDTEDSKRIIANVHQTLKARGQRSVDRDPIINTAIVSHIFWPTLQNEQFKHHPRLQAGLDEFGAEYARLKNPRRLVWMNQLGTIELELDVLEENADGTTTVETREFSVAPLLATLITHFEDKDEWTAEELSNETGVAEDVVQKRMSYWVSQRVVQLQPPSTYTVATRDHLLEGEDDDDAVAMEEDGHGTLAVSVAAQEEEDLAVYESYIYGMLNTHGTLPLERIHNMLKMFVTGSEVKYNKTPQQLSSLLKRMCHQEKLECGPDGMYKLWKK